RWRVATRSTSSSSGGRSCCSSRSAPGWRCTTARTIRSATRRSGGSSTRTPDLSESVAKGAALVSPPSASYHPDMSTPSDDRVIVRSRVSDVVVIVATLLAAGIALVQIALADTGLLERVLAAPAVLLAAALIIRSWQPAACDARLFRLQVAALAALLLAAG